MLKDTLQETGLIAILRGIQPEQSGDVAQMLYSAGIRIVEVPMVLHSRVTGTSKMKVMRSIRMHLQLMLQALAWRFAGAPNSVASPQKLG